MAKARRTTITGKPVTKRVPLPAGGARIETMVPWTLVKRGVRREVITPIGAPTEFREEVQREKLQQKLEKHSPLLRALGLAHHWQQLLDDGTFRSITEIAAAEGIDVAQASRVLRLAQLPPHTITASITSGHASLAELSRSTFPLDWSCPPISELDITQ